MKMNFENDAKNRGWIKVSNGGWLVDNNYVTEGFVERHLKTLEVCEKERLQALTRLNDVINDIINIVADNTPEIKDILKWREMIFAEIGKNLTL